MERANGPRCWGGTRDGQEVRVEFVGRQVTGLAEVRRRLGYRPNPVRPLSKPDSLVACRNCVEAGTHRISFQTRPGGTRMTPFTCVFRITYPGTRNSRGRSNSRWIVNLALGSGVDSERLAARRRPDRFHKQCATPLPARRNLANYDVAISCSNSIKPDVMCFSWRSDNAVGQSLCSNSSQPAAPHWRHPAFGKRPFLQASGLERSGR